MYLRLQIVEADLHQGGYTKPPSAYVQVQVNNAQPIRTKAIKRQFNPVWNEQFTIQASDLSSELCLRVRQNYVLMSKTLGVMRMQISDLLAQRGTKEEQVIQLTLTHSAGKIVVERGSISIRLGITNDAAAAAAAVSHISKDPNSVAIIDPGQYVPTTSDFESTEEKQTDIMQSLSSIAEQLDIFMGIVDDMAQIHPYANLAWQVVSSVYKIARAQWERDQKMSDLASVMRTVYSFVDVVRAHPDKLFSLDDTVRKILSQTIECALFIQEYAGHGFGGRALRGAWTDRRIVSFVKTFTALKDSFDSGIRIQTAVVSFRTDDNVQQLVDGQNLFKLHPIEILDFQRTTCLPNTRIDILESIISFSTTPSRTTPQNIFWLHGVAGSGKSTIATTIADFFRELGRLGAFLPYRRDVVASSDPSAMIRTLAYLLGEFDPRIGGAVSKVIASSPSLRQSPLRWQFLKLLVEPLSSLEFLQHEGPILIVIDALDECGTSAARVDLLAALASESHRLPSAIRIFITSRLEHDIESTFASRSNVLRCSLDITSISNGQDILTFIEHQMSVIQSENKYLFLPIGWPGKQNVDLLAERAQGLFVWASIACRLIEDAQDPDERMSTLVSSSVFSDAESALDGIYTSALESIGKWDDAAFVDDFHEIMGIVVVAKDRLRASSLDAFNSSLNTSPSSSSKKPRVRPCMHTVQRMGCVLLWGEDEPIRVIHPSFAEFLTDHKRCKRDEWFVDAGVHHLRFARQCIALLDSTLKENMCGLVLSKETVRMKLLEDVEYACKFWTEHFCEVEKPPDELAEELDAFLHRHLLHWIEAMSLMKKSRHIIAMLVRFQSWIKAHFTGPTSLLALVDDAVRFSQAFVTIIEQHPLLTYTSALPFTPASTRLYTHFHNRTSYPYLSLGSRLLWSSILMEFTPHQSPITSLTYSTDGKQILTTSGKETRIWDAVSGEMLSDPPLGAHEAEVCGAVFAPDGTRVVSCSRDGTVRLWDPVSGREVCRAMCGHGAPVRAVIYAPNGTRVISAAEDGSMIVWDVTADSGRMLRGPMKGHTRAICSLAYLPDGTGFVSGSVDGTVRVWDACEGREGKELVQGGMGTDESPVLCVAVSPDGTRVAAACKDRKIRVWTLDLGAGSRDMEVRSGTAELALVLTGHTSAVMHVSFSPSGRTLLSTSKDTTLRLWDARTGNEHISLQRRHRHTAPCGAFDPSSSPDGDADDDTKCGETTVRDGGRVASACGDGIVRIWDAGYVGDVGPIKQHKGVVSSVAISPDSKLVASGSHDRTVRLWDAHTGQPITFNASAAPAPLSAPRSTHASIANNSPVPATPLPPLSEPLKGPTQPVRYVGFSSDGARVIAVGRGGELCAWDVRTGARVGNTRGRRWERGRLVLDGQWIVEGLRGAGEGTGGNAEGGAGDGDRDGGREMHVEGGDNRLSARVRTDGYPSRVFGMLPRWAAPSPHVTASSGDFIGVGLSRGSLFIVHFPPASFSFVTSSAPSSHRTDDENTRENVDAT